MKCGKFSLISGGRSESSRKNFVIINWSQSELVKFEIFQSVLCENQIQIEAVLNFFYTDYEKWMYILHFGTTELVSPKVVKVN